MENKEELIKLQSVCNEAIYQSVAQLQKKLLQHADEQQILHFLLSALSSNLGLILSCVPDEYQEEYSDIATTIIQKSLKLAVEENDSSLYGQIGHA